MSYEYIKVEADGPVTTITLNRPERLNTLTEPMVQGVAEGIESALSLAWAFVPVWACIDAGNLAALPVLDGIEALTIAADNDPAGQAAAQTCATRPHNNHVVFMCFILVHQRIP